MDFWGTDILQCLLLLQHHQHMLECWNKDPFLYHIVSFELVISYFPEQVEQYKWQSIILSDLYVGIKRFTKFIPFSTLYLQFSMHNVHRLISSSLQTITEQCSCWGKRPSGFLNTVHLPSSTYSCLQVAYTYMHIFTLPTYSL